MKDYKFQVYVCGCGYETANSGNASKHRKTSCGHSISSETVEFVRKRDHLDVVSKMGCPITYNNTAEVINNTTNNININLVVPEQSVVASIQDAIQSDECIREIRAASPNEIPAILFKYTRGSMAGKPLIKYDPKKDAVESKDPVTGEKVSKKLKKFRNEYLAEQSDIYDETYQIPYLPQPVKRDMLSMTAPQFPTGNKKDTPVSPAEVIKICTTGDHRMYKLPHETKRFFTDVAKNVDIEIKSCAPNGTPGDGARFC
ncbi:protein of unknown function (DUF1390) [Acanthocystis turfacea Chlorella virus GM0701.1]|nr:protein of unknown function (DUF1390) [Acanthocystis turfacea Chlorella virus GM0701.1]